MTEENGKRLTKAQKELVLKWIAEGIESDEINARAAQETPPFHVAKSTVSHYRKTRAIPLAQVQAAGELSAINEGYNTAASRVEKLARLAAVLEQDLLENGKLWVTRKRGIGPASQYEVVEDEEFNGAEVAQYRGTLDDIARETGGRIQKVQQEVEVDLIWDLPVPGFNPPASQNDGD